MIEFNLDNNKIILKPNLRMPKYAGMGVEFDGTYALGDVKLKDTTFAGHGILTLYQEELFKEMTGKYYRIFQATLHRLMQPQHADLDGFGSKVYEFSVTGLSNQLAYIIMVADLFDKLQNPETGLWHLSPKTLSQIFLTEVKEHMFVEFAGHYPLRFDLINSILTD